MKEVQPRSQDKIVIEKQAQQEKQNKLIGRIIPKKGHTIFEVNLKTGDINEAEFEKPIANYSPKTEGNGIKAHFDRFRDIARNTKTSKIKVNKDCLYVSSLNLKNLKKKLLQAGIIEQTAG